MPPYRRPYKPSGAFSRNVSYGRRVAYKAVAAARRGTIVAGLRGYARTGGYFGRFKGRRANIAAGTELKFFDTLRNAFTPAAAGTIADASLNLIAQGVTETDRIGRKCTLKRLDLRGQFAMPAQTAAASTSDRVRFIVYLDKQCNGATATVGGILETATIDSFRNLANTGRFRILAERTVTLVAQGATATAGAYTFGEVKKNLKLSVKLDTPLEFDGVTGALTEIRSNNIGVLAISESALASVDYNVRVRYGDN